MKTFLAPVRSGLNHRDLARGGRSGHRLHAQVWPLEDRQLLSGPHYDIGTPSLVDVWVDPLHGSDDNSGTSRRDALRTVNAAWALVPQGSMLTTGYRLDLTSGSFSEADFPTWMDNRRGTYSAPVVIQAADGSGSVTVPAFQVNSCSYLYLIGLSAQAGGGDVLHVASSDHVLIRGDRLTGTGSGYDRPQESLKVNQSQYVFVEDSEISGAWGNAVDFVAVQYGHVVDSRIHDAGDWVMYFKGGSAYLRVDGNEIWGGGNGGFTAGQGTGFEYMVSPWLNYETYGITVVNNLIHDTDGAGLGVNGAYDVVMAGNTLVRVGRNSHVIEVVFGLRGCDGDVARCQQYLTMGGWGSASPGEGNQQPVPNRHVYLYDNLVYNPAGYRSQWQQFAIAGPTETAEDSNIPSPAEADEDLEIKGEPDLERSG